MGADEWLNIIAMVGTGLVTAAPGAWAFFRWRDNVHSERDKIRRDHETTLARERREHEERMADRFATMQRTFLEKLDQKDARILELHEARLADQKRAATELHGLSEKVIRYVRRTPSDPPSDPSTTSETTTRKRPPA